MTKELDLLNRLIFSREFLDIVKKLTPSIRAKVFYAGWGAKVGYLDLNEVERFGDLTLRQVTSGTDYGGAAIKSAFAKSIALMVSAGIGEDEILRRFLASASFNNFIDIEAYGQRTSVEDAFFRFCSMELLPHLQCGNILTVLTHETLFCLARQVTSGHIEAAAIRHPLFRCTGTGLAALIRSAPDPNAKAVVEINSEPQPAFETTLYFGGARFINGIVPSVAAEMITFAADLDEPDDVLRRRVLAIAYPDNRVLQKLIALEVL